MRLPALLRSATLVAGLSVSAASAGILFIPQVDTYSLKGQASYDITFGGYDPTTDPTMGYISGESKLEFDLKALMTRFGIEASTQDGSVVLTAGYATAASQGSGQFRDRDWLTNHYVNDTLGYDPLGGDTLSNSKSPVRSIDLGLRFRLAHGGPFSLHGLLEYGNDRFGTFKVYDYTGFYRGWMTGGPFVPVHGESETPVLTYVVTYGSYRVGLSPAVELGGGFSLAGFAKCGFATYDDTDDHLLRSRVAKGSGTGSVYDLKGSVSWRAEWGLGLSAFVGARGFSAKGTQHQTYYAGENAGLTAAVDESVKSHETDFGMEVSFRFGKPRAPGKMGSDDVAGSMKEKLRRMQEESGSSALSAAAGYSAPAVTPTATTIPTLPGASASPTPQVSPSPTATGSLPAGTTTAVPTVSPTAGAITPTP